MKKEQFIVETTNGGRYTFVKDNDGGYSFTRGIMEYKVLPEDSEELNNLKVGEKLNLICYIKSLRTHQIDKNEPTRVVSAKIVKIV